ncbi:MAG TPA: tetratricopeptide repeat protein, partial [Fimbriiglobus sp.]
RDLAGPNAARMADALERLGMNSLKQRKFAEAEPTLRECLKIWTANRPDHWLRFNTSSLLGTALLSQQKYTEAEPFLLQGYEGMKQRELKVPPERKDCLPEAAQQLVRLYEATAQPEKASEWRKKLSPMK